MPWSDARFFFLGEHHGHLYPSPTMPYEDESGTMGNIQLRF